MRRPIFLAALAEIQMLSGKAGPARATLQTAAEQADETAEHLWDPELARLTALVAASPEAAVAAARRAVVTAREFGARPLILRSAETLERLEQTPGANAGRTHRPLVSCPSNTVPAFNRRA